MVDYFPDIQLRKRSLINDVLLTAHALPPLFAIILLGDLNVLFNVLHWLDGHCRVLFQYCFLLYCGDNPRDCHLVNIFLHL